MAKQDNRAIEAKRIRALIKKVRRETAADSMMDSSNKGKIEYYNLGWQHATDTILQGFEAIVKEHGWDD